MQIINRFLFCKLQIIIFFHFENYGKPPWIQHCTKSGSDHGSDHWPDHWPEHGLDDRMDDGLHYRSDHGSNGGLDHVNRDKKFRMTTQNKVCVA